MRFFITILMLCSLCVSSVQSQESMLGESYEEILQQSGLGIDNASLLRFLELRSQDSVDEALVSKLIKELGDEDFLTRLKASRELIALGPLAVPALRVALKDPDSQRAKLARRCLQTLNKSDADDLPVTVAKLLSIRQPKKSIDALLRYLPYATGEEKVEQLKIALMNLARSSRSEAGPAIKEALNGKMPLLRSIAIDILRQQGASIHQDQWRELLKDPSPTVKLQAALALGQLNEEQAINELIELLTQLPLSHAQKAEQFLSELAEEQAPKEVLTDAEGSAEKVQTAWKAWWARINDETLLTEVRKRTITPDIKDKSLALMNQLKSNDFDEREEATEQLKNLGVGAAPLLRKYEDSTDPELRYRVRLCLKHIDVDSGGPLSPVVARLLAFRKPQGTAAALLEYLPFAEDQDIENSVQEALNSVAYRDGKPNPVLVEAMQAKLANVRAAAGHALAQAGQEEQLKKVRDLLKDESWKVRMKVALSLAYLQDKDAMPVLIDSIAHLKEDELVNVTEYLTALAGNSVPEGVYAEAATARRDAWSQWWKSNKDKVTLLARDAGTTTEHFIGNIMVISYNYNQIIEYDRNGKQLWRMTSNLGNPRDAQVIGRNKVLVLEYSRRRLTERDFKGNIKWQQSLPSGLYPTSLQHLKNGNNLIAGYNQVVEMTRSGRTVFKYSQPSNNIRTARKLSNGQTMVYTYQGNYITLSRTGKEIKQVRIQSDSSNHGYQILPNGNILIPMKYSNQVREYSKEGKLLWTKSVTQPESVWKLPNGRLVIGSGNSPFNYQVYNRSMTKVLKTVSANIQANRLRAR